VTIAPNIRPGPRLTVEASCHSCSHVKSVKYQDQGDSGYDVECTHVPSDTGAPHPYHIGDSHWRTPPWCPFLDHEQGQLIESLELLRKIRKERNP
jgi:hypothetical protein